MGDKSEGFVPNPLFGSLLGLGPLAAAADTLAEGALLGLGAALGGLLLGSFAARTRAFVPERFRNPLALASSAFFAFFYWLFVENAFPAEGASLGLYLPLIAVNSFLLHGLRRGLRREEAAERRFLLPSLFFFLSALLLSALREGLGLGSLSLPSAGSPELRLILFSSPPLRALAAPAGGFILAGLLAAAYRGGLRALGRRLP